MQYILTNTITWCKNVLLFLAKRIEQTQVKKFIPGQSDCQICYSRMLIKFKYASISDKSPSRCLVPNTLSQLIVSYRLFRIETAVEADLDRWRSIGSDHGDFRSIGQTRKNTATAYYLRFEYFKRSSGSYRVVRWKLGVTRLKR